MARESNSNKNVVGRDKISEKYLPVNSELMKTDIIPLDLVLGGGIPRGALVELAGPTGTGKSSVMAHVSKNLCSRGLKVDWMDFEHALTSGLKQGIGLQEYEERQLFTHLDPITYGDAEEILEGLGNELPDLIVVDSDVAILVDSSMDISIIDTQAIGLKSRVEAIFLAKYKGWVRKNNVTIVFINQMRTKFESRGRSMIAIEDSAGGNAFKHYMDIRLRLKRTGDLKRKDSTIEGEKEIIYGAETALWAVKNKNVRSHIELSMPIIFGRGVSNMMVIKTVLVEAGLVVSSGSYFKINIPGVYEGSVQGNKGLNEFIKEKRKEVDEYIQKNEMLFLVRESGE